MIDTVIVACGASVVAGMFSVITFLLNHRATVKDRQMKMEDGIQSGVRTLLYDRIKHRAKRFIQDGYITVEGLEDLEHMWSVYHEDLNGNGFLDSLMQEVRALPKRGE